DPPFQGLGENCYMISRPDDRSLLSGLDVVPVENIEDAHFILINSFDAAAMKLEDLDPVFKTAAAKRIPMICANPDMVTLYGHERAPGPGAVAARYKVSIRPTLVFARDGAVLGALPRMRDWAVYLDEVSRLLAGAGEGVS
ncbi:MAG TPA: hypothetical protein PLY97_01100, partial [Acidocella sp.]|nr:hypothetical protein [Acidocella sp.]